jgi:septum site-determining protein MinD
MVRDKRLPELYLLPAAQTRDKTAVQPDQMVEVCEELRPNLDFILIDSPAGIEQGFRNAIAPADEAVIVTTPEVSAVRDADRIIGLIEAAEKENMQLIVNRLRPEMVRRENMLSIEDVLDVLAIDLLGVVPEDEQIIVATNRGRPLALDNHARAGHAFNNIARRVLGEDVPFLPLEKETLISRVKRFFRS